MAVQQSDKHILGEFFSWNIVQEDVAIKKADKSFFDYNGSAIPRDIKWFFDCENQKRSTSKKIVLEKQGKQFAGRIMADPTDRCRIFWSSELTREFEQYHHPEAAEYHIVRFQRISSDFYLVDCLDETIIEVEKDTPFDSEVIPQKEGKKKEIYTSKYERNPVNRMNAIKIHGTKCMVCGFDFEAFYGEAGRNFIEVHHIKPLSDIGEEISVNPEKDLVCVCSNCHRIIHRKKNGIYSLDEVRSMIAKEKGVK